MNIDCTRDNKYTFVSFTLCTNDREIATVGVTARRGQVITAKVVLVVPVWKIERTEAGCGVCLQIDAEIVVPLMRWLYAVELIPYERVFFFYGRLLYHR